MARAIGGVVVGYLVMFVFVFASFSIAYLALGANLAFQPGSYHVSMLWIAVMVVLNFVAAFLGGLVCSLIAKNPRASMSLAAVVLVLGLVMAIPVLTGAIGEPPATRDASVGNLEAMQHARQPAWSSVASPLIGVVGVLIGGRRQRKGAPA